MLQEGAGSEEGGAGEGDAGAAADQGAAGWMGWISQVTHIHLCLNVSLG